ncbi:hypothetical protein EUGRSUZ_C04121 [Eucalyptus grandis]|uniref:Uncharacterized protein n=2 Tax=Eucalyptus grandis TaxID=71139 RepID=A0ACC3LL62_EUCGR|nr:hypothetical protein EUGRSUZ_C04121 [Eucalyptus grandis]
MDYTPIFGKRSSTLAPVHLFHISHIIKTIAPVKGMVCSSQMNTFNCRTNQSSENSKESFYFFFNMIDREATLSATSCHGEATGAQPTPTERQSGHHAHHVKRRKPEGRPRASKRARSQT